MHVFHISLKNISFKLSHSQCRTFALGIFMMWHTFTLSIALCRTFCLGGEGEAGGVTQHFFFLLLKFVTKLLHVALHYLVSSGAA